MIKIVDRYMGRAAFLGILAVWVSLTMIMAMFLFLDRLGDAEEGVRFAEIVSYVVLKSANSAYVVFPVSALLGAMIGIGGLASSNELVAFRTAGASRLRISFSVLGTVFFLSLAVMAFGEWVMPVAEQRAKAIGSAAASGGVVTGTVEGIWIRDGNDFISIGRSVLYAGDDEPDVTLHNVVRYTFDDGRRLRSVDGAASARYEDDAWVVENNTRVVFDEDGVQRTFSSEQPWAAGFDPQVLSTAVVRPRYMSLRSIVDQWDYLRQNGLDDRAYATEFWNKVLFPLIVLALVLAGMPFLFGSARSQSLGLRIFVGMSLGGAFMIVSKTLQNLSEAYALPPWLGAALPSLVLASVVILVLRRSV